MMMDLATLSSIPPRIVVDKLDAFVPPSAFDQFKEYQFTAQDLPAFTGYQIKIVFSGTNESYAPRLNDIRAIALA